MVQMRMGYKPDEPMSERRKDVIRFVARLYGTGTDDFTTEEHWSIAEVIYIRGFTERGEAALEELVSRLPKDG